MRPSGHIKLSIIPGIVIIYFDWEYAMLFFLGSVIIDVDHAIEYYIKTGDTNILRMYKFYEILLKEFRKSYYIGISAFHTAEFLLVLIYIQFVSGYGIYFFLGYIFHQLIDIIYLHQKGWLANRCYSIIYYIYVSRFRRNRNFIIMEEKEKKILKQLLDSVHP